MELGRTVPKVCALMSAYHRASEEIFRVAKFNVDPSVEQDNPQLKEQNDSLLKLNYQYWLEYSWLKEQDNFDMDKVKLLSVTKRQEKENCVYFYIYLYLLCSGLKRQNWRRSSRWCMWRQ